MKLCARSRCRQPFQRSLQRHLSSCTARRVDRRYTSLDGEHDEEYTSAFVPDDDGLRTVKTRGAGRKSLPVSPVLDPLVTAARTQWKQPKPNQKTIEHLTDFQKELNSNPYAKALATTVRRCLYTDAILPEHFLQDFNYVFKPEWPESKTRSNTKAASTPTTVPDASPEDEETAIAATNSQTATTTTPSTAQPSPLATATTTIAQRLAPHIIPTPKNYSIPGGEIHVLSNYPLIQRLGRNKASWQKLIHADVVKRYGKDRQDWIWRRDMHDVVLDRMRAEVVSTLRWGFVHHKAGMLVAVESGSSRGGEGREGGEGVGDKEEVSHGGSAEAPEKRCLLVLREGGEEQRGEGPREGVDGIPSYNLPSLLGEKVFAELVKDSVFGTASVVALVKKWGTTSTHVSLERLAGFLRGTKMSK